MVGCLPLREHSLWSKALRAHFLAVTKSRASHLLCRDFAIALFRSHGLDQIEHLRFYSAPG